MKELKRYTIKTSYSTETKICYDLEEYMMGFCDAYEVIKEESATEKQPLFDKYFNMIPGELFGKHSFDFWVNEVLEVINGWYDNFEHMIKENSN